MVEYSREKLFLMQQVYSTLFSLSNKLQIQGDEYLKGLTSRQLMTMMAIIHLPEDGTTLNNIARKLGTSKQNVKQIVTIIERKGYVVITSSESDKRSYNVKITESGKQVLFECSERGMIFFEDVFKDFSKEELELLWNFLKRIYRFDNEEQDGFEEEINLKMDLNLKKGQNNDK
jgi:DNA-binding MarR family transcriptional regulator